MKQKIVTVIALIACLFVADAATANTGKSIIKSGVWRGVLEMQGLELPFNFKVTTDAAGEYDIQIMNGEERLRLDEVRITGDSINIALHIFDANIKAKILGHGDSLSGVFINNYEQHYHIPFHAEHGKGYRFVKVDLNSTTEPDSSGK